MNKIGNKIRLLQTIIKKNKYCETDKGGINE